jgi:hypothetical protein
MRSSHVRRVAALTAVSACALAVQSAAAAAATTPFGCTASVAKLTSTSALATTQAYDQANPADTPCATDAATTAPQSYSAGGVSVAIQQAGAYTGSSMMADPTAAIAPSAGATAAFNGATISYTSPDGTSHTVQIAPSSATATDVCMAGHAVATGVSNAGDVTVDGHSVVQSGNPTSPQTFALPDSNGSYVALNQQSVSGATLTQTTALVHLAGIGDLALEQASVTAGSCPPVTIPILPPVSECPSGSTFLPTTLLCEIVSGSVKVPVAAPYQGPTGGVVVPLGVARRLYPGNPCVKGAGPAYVIVATPTRRVINGTKGADRILGLDFDDRLAGLNGNDCISAGNGDDQIYDSQGNDRITAGNGHDRVGLGNGNDTIKVGNGRDWVSAGRGNDTVTVGAGRDRIDLGRGRNVVHTGRGRDRVFTRSRTAHVSCVDHRDVTFLTRTAANWALRHGCDAPHVIR